MNGPEWLSLTTHEPSESGGRAAGGLASYRLYQRETSLEMRQVFMAGPDHEQVEAPPSYAPCREVSGNLMVIACAVGHLWPQVLELPRARKACQRCLAASFRLTS
jgi:hypothetical protein